MGGGSGFANGHSPEGGAGGVTVVGGAPGSPTENTGGSGGSGTSAGGTSSAGYAGEPSSPSMGGEAGGPSGQVRTVRCDATKPFSPPLFIPAVASYQLYDASISWDGLTLMIWGNRELPHLLSSTRPSLEADFGEPTMDPLLQVAGDWLLQAQDPDVPSFTGDALYLYAQWGGESWYAVHSAKRASTLSAFDVPQVLDDLKGLGLFKPAISYDGEAIYGVRNDASVALVSRKVSGRFAQPAQILATNSPGSLGQPVINESETALYFSSTRTDGSSKGHGDIWVSTRPTKQADFGTPHAVDELNTPEEKEQPIWVSNDGCDIVILRNQSLAMARRPK